MIKGPVCGKTVNPQHAAANVLYKGQMYYLCSPVCKTMFECETGKYAKSGVTKSKQGNPLLLYDGEKT